MRSKQAVKIGSRSSFSLYLANWWIGQQHVITWKDIDGWMKTKETDKLEIDMEELFYGMQSRQIDEEDELFVLWLYLKRVVYKRLEGWMTRQSKLALKEKDVRQAFLWLGMVLEMQDQIEEDSQLSCTPPRNKELLSLMLVLKMCDGQ